MTTVAQRLLTVEDFFRLNPEGHCELVRGEVVTMSTKKWLHGRLAHWIDRLLIPVLEAQPLGRVAIESGFATQRNPDTFRIPDLVYVSFERWSLEEEQSVIDDEGVLPVAPDLAVEILSPDDRWSDVEDKIEEYLHAGVRLLWIIHPRQQLVYIYRADGSVTRLAPKDVLTGEDVVPGFEVTVAELLAGPPHTRAPKPTNP